MSKHTFILAREATNRYVGPAIAKKFAESKGENCPFCGDEDIGYCEDEIATWGSNDEPGCGYASCMCRECGSKWPVTFQVQKIGISNDFICPNEFLHRDEMLPEDIAAMKKDGWVWDNDPRTPGWFPPKNLLDKS